MAKNRKYGRAWKRIRDKYAKDHPYCQFCEIKGVSKPTEEIHHIIGVSVGGRHNRDNLVALCKDCHANIHSIHKEETHSERGNK